RDLINQNFYNGEATLLNGVLPPAIPGYNEEQPEIKYDVETAKKLLKDAGHESDVTLTILQNGESSYTHPINEMIQSMLGEVGIK
ncbi:ABC transporter substrate-binding protein, partial [Acinetobacter baumannii]|nr:ABC transporter substrate-binding protein [Acinetobacter baumannii]